MKVVVGHCEDIDTRDAVAEVLESCHRDLDGLVPQAGILFASIHHDFQIITSAILDTFPTLELIGCSTDGELSSVMGYAEDSVALMLFHSDAIEMRAGVGKNVTNQPHEAAHNAVAMATRTMTEAPSVCITLPEVWNVNIRGVLDGLEEALGIDVPVFGGAATSETHVGPTIQCFKGEVLSDAVPILLFSGSVHISAAAQSGWKPIGTKHRITKSTGSVVATIDDRPAEDLFIQYFGGHSLFYPVAVYPIEDGPFYLATPANVVDDGGIFFFNHLPTGSIVQFADASPDEIIEAAAASSKEAVSYFPGKKPAAGLIFSCAGRRAALGTRTKEEVQLLRDELGEEVPLIGFYSGGELCPLRGQKKTQSHGFTFTTVLIGEG